MDNIVRQADAIKNQGMFFSPIAGDRKLPAVATRDIAAAASRLLLDDSWSGVGEVPLLGPEDLSFNDMAEIISEVLAGLVGYLALPFDLVPDFIPIAGQLDDVMVVGLVLRSLVRADGSELLRQHWPGPQRSLELVLRAAGIRA